MTFISGGEPPIITVTPEATPLVDVILDEDKIIELQFEDPPLLQVLQEDPQDLTIIGLGGPPGPQGPPGPEGPPGEAGVGASFRFVQPVASTQWDITHTIPYPPAVTAVDSAGEVIVPSIFYLSGSQVRLIFSAAVAGEAYLS